MQIKANFLMKESDALKINLIQLEEKLILWGKQTFLWRIFVVNVDSIAWKFQKKVTHLFIPSITSIFFYMDNLTIASSLLLLT